MVGLARWARSHDAKNRRSRNLYGRESAMVRFERSEMLNMDSVVKSGHPTVPLSVLSPFPTTP
jgi:hypothetical protein